MAEDAFIRIVAEIGGLRRAMRRAQINIEHLMFEVDVLTMPDPEVVVAGIEGRAIVRAGMRDILDWIGEKS